MQGMLLMVTGVSLFAVIDGMAKILAADLPAMQVIWGRYLFSLLPLAVLIPWRRWPTLLRTDRMALQLVRALMPLLAGLFIVLALRYMPLADATAILFVSPLMVTALSIPLLGERVGLHRWAAVIIGFAAVIVIVRPGGGTMHWAALLPLGTAFVYALYQIATRILSRSAGPLSTLAFTILIGLAASSLALPFGWRTPTAFQWSLLVVSGVLHGLSHFCVIRAFLTAGAATLAPFNYAQLIAAIIFGLLVFDEFPDATTILGALVIVAAGLYVAWRERTRSAPPEAGVNPAATPDSQR
jgi:drug/metabolite transporter (DMT)-like permease